MHVLRRLHRGHEVRLPELRRRARAPASPHCLLASRPVNARGALPWQAQFVLLASIWGSSFLFIKIAVDDLAPVNVALGRCALGALTLLAVLRVRGERLPRDRRLWGHLAVAALLLNAAPFTLFAIGETHISSVLAGIWNATTPLLTAVVVLAALPEERPTARRVAGLLVGFAGVLLVLGPWDLRAAGSLAGNLACLGAACCYALGNPYTRRYLAASPVPLTGLAAAQLLCATAQLAAVAALTSPAPAGVSLKTAASMLALGALGTGVAYQLVYGIIRATSATTAASVTYLIPVFSTALGVAVLDESVAWHQPLGALVILTGVAITQGLIRGARRAVESPI
jgi:drug/metabolite transporter (DMT)-like permease